MIQKLAEIQYCMLLFPEVVSSMLIWQHIIVVMPPKIAIFTKKQKKNNRTKFMLACNFFPYLVPSWQESIVDPLEEKKAIDLIEVRAG